MAPIANEKKKEPFLKRKHSRSSSAHISPIESSNEVPSRGWLESVSVQVKPSRSLDRKPPPPTLVEPKKTLPPHLSQKDVLGAVSDEDILKLTEITAQLPKLTTLNTKPSKPSTPISKTPERPSPSIQTTSTPASSVSSLENPTDTKRASWLRKLKPNRSRSSRKENNILSSDDLPDGKTPAAYMVEQFYQKHGRSPALEDQSSDVDSFVRQRRHSFDSFQSYHSDTLFLPQDESGEDEDEERTQGEVETEGSEENISKNIVRLLFDYDSLPTELKSLIDAYEYKGKVEHVQKTVWYEQKDKGDDALSSVLTTEGDEDEDEENEEEEEEEEEEDAVYFKQLIKGKVDQANFKSNPVRDIAILTTTDAEPIEFTKLVQLPSEKPNEHGPLLNLQISLVDPDRDSQQEEEEIEIQEMIHGLDLKLASLNAFEAYSKQFLQDHFDANLLNSNRPLTRTISNPQLKEMKQEEASFLTGHRHSMYENNHDYAEDTFDNRVKSTAFLINSLAEELKEFKQSLDQTELLIQDVQLDMDDFRNRMEVYIKDIPESHYSALKQLELDIESILSKRAKNPWMDTGYALLSYLLTLFALGVWIVIYMIKLSKKIVLFPFKLWKDYSDYLVERNEAVKKASMRTVSTSRRSSQANLIGRTQERASSSSSFVTAYHGDDHLFPQRPPSKKQ